MKAIISYIIKSIRSTPVVSAIIAVILSVSAVLFCVAFDFKRQVMEDAVRKHLVELGDSTLNMTFDESSSVRFFTLSALKRAQSFDADDFDYIIGGYKFTTVIRAAASDFAVKAHAYSDVSDTTLTGDRVLQRFSDIRLIKARQNPVWFDNDVIIPLSVATRLNLDVGSNLELALGNVNKTMTVSGIAENRGLFADNNILVDYEGMLNSISSLFPVALPLNVYNTALFKLKDTRKADFYISAIKEIREYSDKAVVLSLDYDALYKENLPKISTRQAVSFLFILLLFAVVLFMVNGRLKTHEPAIKILKEQGADGVSLCLMFLAEIALFGFIGCLAGILFVSISGISASVLPAFLCIPLCVTGYLWRFAAPHIRLGKLRIPLLCGGVLIAVILFIFAFKPFFFVMLPVCVLFCVTAGDFLTRLLCRGKFNKSGKAETPQKQEARKKEQSKITAKLAPVKSSKIPKEKNRGMYRTLARSSSDKTSGVFMAINGILLTIIILYCSYLPVMNNLFDKTDAQYVITNVAAAGRDIALEVEETEGVEKAIPAYWTPKFNLGIIKGETVKTDIFCVKQDDYGYFKRMLSIGGGIDALKPGQAVISANLSKKLGLKAGDTVKTPISGENHEIEICAVLKSSLLNNFIMAEATALPSFNYNNILLKLDGRADSQTLAALYARYSLQNLIILEKRDVVNLAANFADEMLGFLRLIFTIAAALSFVSLFALFVIKKNRERPAERTMKESGASPLQVYQISLFSQLLSSIFAVIIGCILCVAFIYLLSFYFAYMGATIVLNIPQLIPVALAAEAIIFCGYILTFSLTKLL